MRATGPFLASIGSMRISITMLAVGLLTLGYPNVSTAQDIQIHEVSWTFALDCDAGLGYGVDIFVDAQGPSPGDIIISGSVEGCSPDLGPFTSSSIACYNTTDMAGAAMAVDRNNEDNMDTVDFTIVPCVNGSQTYDGTGGSGGDGGSGGVAGVGGTAGAGGTAGGGAAAGSGGTGEPTDPPDGCSCTVQGSEPDYAKIGFGLLLTLGVFGILRKRGRG